MKSIFIVMLLSIALFGTQNQTYVKHPGQEFNNGYKKKYVCDGDGKAQGLKFSFEYPSSWVSKEAYRPHIVRKFISQYRNGLESAMIMVRNLPNAKYLSKKQLELVAKQVLNQHALPSSAVLKDSGFIYLETLPGYWQRFTMILKRLKITLKVEVMQYTLFYKDKIIDIQFMSSTPNGKGSKERFKKYEPLFNAMANSFVLFNVYE